MTPENINRVVYAGQSHRRHAFLRHEFAEAQIDSFPGGDEPDIPNVVAIMHGKIDYVLANFLNNEPVDSINPALVLAADTRTATVSLTDDGKNVSLVSRGKPQGDTEAQDTFVSMMQASRATSRPPIYMVESASGSHLTGRNHREQAKRFTVVELDPHAVEYFATDRGFIVYRSALERFYSGPAYRHEGLPPIGITDLSAGLSLPVLVRLGAVQSIDQINADHEQFPHAFKKAVYTVAVGFAPETWGGDSHATINGWPWLDKVAEQSIKK